VPVKDDSAFCRGCRLNSIIPDLSHPGALTAWGRIEHAKKRLLYTLMDLGLSIDSQREKKGGLVFSFLESDAQAPSPVLTGHDDGHITLNIAEADNPGRERLREQLGETYRTLLGHFRHEIGHYYWDRLIADTPHLEEFRRIFGDERQDYDQALQNYYVNGPIADWSEHFISPYASAHPWEDFAETWAHYFHMIDTLETAHVAGLAVSPKLPQSPGAVFDFHPVNTGMDRLVEAWLALTFAVNSINRSMGLRDLYPFVLGPLAVKKLTFVQNQIRAVSKPATKSIRDSELQKSALGHLLRSETA
jgi:hypothetical protein